MTKNLSLRHWLSERQGTISITWRSGKRCEDNNGGEEEEEMTFPAASSRRLERTPGVREAIVCRRGKVASFGRRKKRVGNLKRDVSGSVESLSVTMAGNRQFCQNAKKTLCLGDLEGCRKLLLVAGVKHEDLFD